MSSPSPSADRSCLQVSPDAAGVDDLYDLAVERAAGDADVDDRFDDLHETVERRLDELVDSAGFEAAYRAAAAPPDDGDDD